MAEVAVVKMVVLFVIMIEQQQQHQDK